MSWPQTGRPDTSESARGRTKLESHVTGDSESDRWIGDQARASQCALASTRDTIRCVPSASLGIGSICT
jgi:hypothetical protein